ncbi:hypothetical protein WI26_00040 [Burkholderia diffusa]|nr:hypothetical protein WI26_00040 [Burkholderia diffusa]
MQFSIQLNRIHAIDDAALALRVVSNDGLPIVLTEDAFEVIREQQEEQHVTKLSCFPIGDLAKPFIKCPPVCDQLQLLNVA